MGASSGWVGEGLGGSSLSRGGSTTASLGGPRGRLQGRSASLSVPGAPDPPELEAAACRGTAASLGVGRKSAGGAGGGGGWEGTEGRATAVSFSHSGFSHSVLTLVFMALLASPSAREFSARATWFQSLDASPCAATKALLCGSWRLRALQDVSPVTWPRISMLSPPMRQWKCFRPK